jgi:hypothetical protein
VVYAELKDDVGEERKGGEIGVLIFKSWLTDQTVELKKEWKEKASFSPSSDSELRLTFLITQAWLGTV